MNAREHRSGDAAPLWDDLLSRYGGIVGELRRSADAVRQLAGVPEEWVRIFAEGDRVGRAIAPWAERMPRFARYLGSSLLDVGVGDGIGGPVMAYLIRDWTERGYQDYEPGLMIGGLPSPTRLLDDLEDDVGRLPPSLRAAWEIHSFAHLKTGGWLGSLRPEGYEIVLPPAILPHTATGWVGEVYGEFECLEILNPGTRRRGCLVRPPGTGAWMDHIVYPEGDQIVDSLRPTLEETFTDWEQDAWSEP